MRTAFRTVGCTSVGLAVLLSTPLFAEPRPTPEERTTGDQRASSPTDWKRRIQTGGLAGAALQRTLQGASHRLEEPGCQDVYQAFADVPSFQAGAQLQALGLTLAQYLTVMVFVDGRDRPLCRHADVLAVTTPGSRVVYVCGPHFAEAATRDPENTEAVLIHEELHSLGLPENPPGSREITRRVLARCGDAVTATAARAQAPGSPGK